MSYRVLECNVDDIGKSGVYSLIRNVIIHNDRDSGVDIDIACINPFEDTRDIDELKKYHSNVYFVGAEHSKIMRYINVYHKTKALLQRQHYDCVHIHSDISFKVYPFLKAAKDAGIQKIIVHSHASSIDGKYRKIKNVLHHHYKKYISDNATEIVSCSDVAAQWMFDNDKQNDVKIINNGIDLQKFAFDPETRQHVRHQLGCADNEVIIGNVGRMAYQKNHKFLVQVFAEFHQVHPRSKLLLVGEGPLKSEIHAQVQQLGLQDAVIFYGTSNNVNELYQAMDVFALSSHFEGLPISGIEAQASGLPVVFADTITKEAAITDNCKFVPIDGNDAIQKWVQQLGNFISYKHQDTTDEMAAKGFSIKYTINQFLLLYTK